MKDVKEIEKSIIKSYRKEIWSKFVRAVKTYSLINAGDKVAVCISGGKDSFLLAKCIQELHKHSDFDFDVKYIVMNPGYNPKNLDLIVENAKHLDIDIEIFDTPIFDYVTSLDGGSPCYMCARMRRGYLYSKAQSLGCNKIALGHHFNDVIETTLLNILYGSEIKTMLPKLHSKNFENMELIRPLYLVKEDDIIRWVKASDLHFLNCACKFTEDSSHDESLSKRKEMKELIKELKKVNNNVDMNIFKSLDNVNLDSVLSYKQGDKKVSFLDNYDE